jgi:hypothetical protein
LSGDPLGAAYRYAGNNPVNMVDPTGLYEACIPRDPDMAPLCMEVDPDSQTSGVFDPTPPLILVLHEPDGGNPPADAVMNEVGKRYEPTDLMAAATRAGFSTNELGDSSHSQAVVIVAVVLSESGGENIQNKWPPPGNPDVVGVLQIDTSQHPISKADAYDVQKAFNFAYQSISEKGTYFKPWDAFRFGNYLRCIDQAEAALRGTNLPITLNHCQ